MRALDRSIKRVCVCGNHDIGNTPTGHVTSPRTQLLRLAHDSHQLLIADASIQNFRDAHATDDKLIFWEGGVRFVAVNTQLFKDASSAPISRENQLQFLRDNLAVRARTVAFGHIPPFIASYDEPNGYSPQRHQPE